MKKQIINLQFNKQPENENYSVVLGHGILANIGNCFDLQKYSKIFILTDSNVAKFWLKKLLSGLAAKKTASIIIPAGEKNKNLAIAQKVWRAMLSNQLDRKSLLINLGGGVVCDLGGLAAGCYMRGIDYLSCPTTLLSQIDASVGGKTAVNFGQVKNLVGFFNQPKGVLIDIDTLKTLPQREFRAGMAEAIKHGLIKDENYFNSINGKAIKDFSQEKLAELIALSIGIKSQVVMADEKENGLRKILNFGHTLGHALEALSLQKKGQSQLLHGEAVVLGIVGEAKISQLLGFISLGDLQAIEKKIFACGLPIRSALALNRQQIIKKMQGDKKSVAGQTQWVLLEKIGQAIFDQPVSAEIVKKALEYLSGKYAQ